MGSCLYLIAAVSAFLIAILLLREFIIGPAELRTNLRGVAWHYDATCVHRGAAVDRRMVCNVALRRSAS